MTGPSTIRACAALLCIASAALSYADAPTPLARELSILAEEGLRGTPEGFQAAERAYETARRLAPDSPGIDYAWSLVLTKNRKFEQAEEAFQKALTASPPCLGAHVSDLRNRLRVRKFTEASERLVEVAEMIGDPTRKDLGESERKAAALVLGKTYAYLLHVQDEPAHGVFLKRREAAIRAYLGRFEAEFRRGEQELGAKYRALQDELAAAAQDAADQQVEDLREANDKLQKIEDQRKSASSESQKTQKVLRERVSDLDAKLLSLEKQYGTLKNSEETLLSSILKLQQSILQIQTDLDRLDRTAVQNPRLNVDNARWVLQQQMARMSVELELTQNSLILIQVDMSRALQNARPLMQARVASASMQGQVANNSARMSETLQRWEKTIQEQSKQIAKAAPEKSGRVNALRLRMRSWNTYDDFDPVDELTAMRIP